MKKNVFFVLILGMALALGMIFIGCHTGCPSLGDDCDVAKDSTGHAYRQHICDNGDCSATSLYRSNSKSAGEAKCSC
ncbi:hypothetical protein FACS1894137_19450 [Spirochaetia bacterium]|nr:hypothetical protein FACS1894137_19450 [Spirochaetia bacterium]